MGKPETDAAPASERLAAMDYPELQEVTYLRRALEIAEQDGLGLVRADVQRVEAMWSIEDGDWTAMGFVLLLSQDGRRVYLEYDFDFTGDSETVKLQAMGDERFPAIEGGGDWSETVGELNRLLWS